MPNSRLYEFDRDLLRRLRKIAVVGDLHGDLVAINSLLRVVDLTRDGVVFLGDYADRGERGFEVIETVNSLMKKYPRNVVALKGNHEDFTDSGIPASSPCDLISEVERKVGNWQTYFQNQFKPFMESLYLAAIIPSEILFVHGGVSSKIRSLDDLRYPPKNVEDDVIWSDPSNSLGEYRNPRGAGILFGPDISQQVCRSLGVKRIIRSHEPMKALEGPNYAHGGRVITITSTRAYQKQITIPIKPFIGVIDPTNPSNISYQFL